MIDAQHPNIRWPIELSDQTISELLETSELISDKLFLKNTLEYEGRIGISYIVDGLVTVCTRAQGDQYSVSGVLGASDWFGGLRVFDYPNFVVNTIELEPLTTVFFPKSRIEQLALKNAEIYKFLFAIAQENNPRWIQTLTIAQFDITSAIKYYLLELVARKQHVVGSLPCLNITQQQFADVVNISRPRVNEVFQHLIRQEVIELSRGKIFFTNLAPLIKDVKDLDLAIHTPSINPST